MIAMQEHPKEGDRRKRQAHALLQARREVYVNRGRRALLKALLLADTATIDDVRLAVALPDEINPVCFGVVPGPLAKRGIIRRVSFTETTRAAGHARPVAVWQLIDRAAAMRWLAVHPDAPDPQPVSPEKGYLFDALTLTKNAGGATPAQPS